MIPNFFRRAKEYPKYQISENGRVWSDRSKRFLEPTPNNDSGHLCTSRLQRPYKKSRKEYVHRLVASAWNGADIHNSDHNTEVSHKDGNPLNNHHSNLEVTTHSEISKQVWKRRKKKN